MSRILAIDYGTKRTGIAVTDPLQIIATPLQGVSTHTLFDFLTSYFEKEAVEKIVVGWPTQADDSLSSNAVNVQAFINRFKKLFPDKPVLLQDEYHTSKDAMRSLIAGGVKKKQRRNKLQIDVTSAVLILQAYMSE
ncbi:MAG: putative Holliday junction resolvase [Cyclobacteriaceae bacterium]|jgi:putative Holliday junction resolvase